jgi:hypothetical protein
LYDAKFAKSEVMKEHSEQADGVIKTEWEENYGNEKVWETHHEYEDNYGQDVTPCP